MRRFCFTDSSGILKSDRFFGTGLLVVKNVGDLGDKLCKNSQPAKEKVKVSKNKRIDELTLQGNFTEIISMLRKGSKFEMKFDHIGSKLLAPYFDTMFDIFLADSENRFSVMIVDRKNPNFDDASMEDAWETYTKYVAILVVRELKSLPPEDELCLVVDEISRPRNKPLSLEDSILAKIREEISKDNSLDFNRIFGVISIESHSNMLMQLCDILLGAVMYEYKKKNNLTTPGTELKKEAFVQKMRNTIGVETLANEFTDSSKVYFNVFEGV